MVVCLMDCNLQRFCDNKINVLLVSVEDLKLKFLTEINPISNQLPLIVLGFHAFSKASKTQLM